MTDIHVTKTRAEWTIQTWHPDDIDFSKTKNLIRLLDKLKETKEVKPISSVDKLNVITTAGLKQMSLRNLPGSHTRTQNTHHAVGIGTRLENLADESLQSQVGIKEITSSAEQAGAERYASYFARGDVGDQDRQLTEFGIFTAAADGILFCRATTSQPYAVSNTATVTASTRITHRNGTQIPT